MPPAPRRVACVLGYSIGRRYVNPARLLSRLLLCLTMRAMYDEWRTTGGPANFITEMIYLKATVNHYGLMRVILSAQGRVKALDERQKVVDPYESDPTRRESAALFLLLSSRADRRLMRGVIASKKSKV